MNPDKPSSTSENELPGSGELERGSTVGRYLVVNLIGKGGMGEVYAAYDPELDRKIALKLLRARTTAGVDPSEGRSRLLREAQVIARLSDPNVVVMFDVGTFGDRVFLAMEFVDGNTLGYWLHAKPRTWREIVTTFTAAGRGLASAHKAGLVHRDFKPDNVMIARDGQIRVMDFGLARVIDTSASSLTNVGDKPPSDPTPGGASPSKTRPSFEAVPGASESRSGSLALSALAARAAALAAQAVVVASRAEATSAAQGATPDGPPPGGVAIWSQDDTDTRDLSRVATGLRMDSPSSALNSRLTITGAMMGTPAYMAPEQFQSGTIDARTDQFSFCVALYEALYRQRPFAGKAIHELTTNVMSGRVREPPSTARVPGWLRRVLLRGLRVDRTERHASMEALLAALARDPGRARRRWAAVGATMSLIAVLAVGLVRAERHQRMKCQDAAAKLAGIWEVPNGKGLSPRKEAIRRTFMATGKRYAADSFVVVSNALDRYVTAWNDMHREACEATNMRGEQSAEVLDLRMSCLQDRFSEVRALASVFSDANGDVVSKAIGASQSMKPVEQCADIVTLRAVVRPPDNPAVRKAVAELRSQLADVKALANAGRYKKASDQIDRITDPVLNTGYQPIMAETLMQLGELQAAMGEPAKAEISLEHAVWTAEASRHDEVAVEAAAQLIYVVGYLQARFTDGVRWSKHATAVLARLGPGHDVIAGWRANNVGIMYERQGRFDEGLAADTEAVELKTRALGGAHFDVGLSQSNVALALFRLGRVDDAIDQNNQALKIVRTALGPDHPHMAALLNNDAEFRNAKGRYGEARTTANQALAIWERESGSEHPFLGYPLTTIGESLIGEGQPTMAVPYLERALRIREDKDREAELLGETRFALARALWGTSHTRDRAMSLAVQARTDYEKTGIAEKQKADVDRWIDAHATRAQQLSMR